MDTPLACTAPCTLIPVLPVHLRETWTTVHVPYEQVTLSPSVDHHHSPSARTKPSYPQSQCGRILQSECADEDELPEVPVWTNIAVRVRGFR